MAYADWIFYRDTYAGDAIDESDFPRLAARASEVIDQITFGRAVAETTDPELTLIKKATCAIADEMQAIQLAGSVDGVSGESVGSTSVTYNKNATRSMTLEARFTRVAKPFLASTGLLYRGFFTGEMGSAFD